MKQVIGRMGLVCGLLMTLVFFVPAFESHACAQERSPPVAQAAIEAPTERDVQCPDCGPACANGCCHAPHAATAPDVAVTAATRSVVAPAVWTHVVGRPLDAAGGPERPPRL